MEKRLVRSALPLLTAMVVAGAPVGAQEGASVSGQVREVGTNAPIAGATVAIPALQRLTTTDSLGRFTLTGLVEGTHEWAIGALGFVSVADRMEVRDGDRFTVGMMAAPVEVGGVTVSAPTVDHYFEARLTRGGGAVKLITGAELMRRGAPNVEQLVMTVAGLRPCVLGEFGFRIVTDVAFAETICAQRRGRYLPVDAIWIDGRPAMGGFNELSTYQPHEIYAVEIAEGGRRINAFTLKYAERLARGRESIPANSPVN